MTSRVCQPEPRTPQIPALRSKIFLYLDFPSARTQRCGTICIQLFDGRHMAQLVVTEKIDGNPVAWRCSDCNQSFSAGRELSSQERQDQVTAEFKSHMGERHKGESAKPMAFAAAVPLPKDRY